MMIIGLAGTAGSGKDTVANHLRDKHGFAVVALADPMKRFLQDMFAWKPEALWGPSDKRNKPDKAHRRYNPYDAQGRPLDKCACGRAFPGPEEYRDHLPCDFVFKGPEFLTPRHALQRLGDYLYEMYPDTLVEYALGVAKELLSTFDWGPPIGEAGAADYYKETGIIPRPCQLDGSGEGRRYYRGVVIPDVRRDNEAKAIRAAGGTIWQIHRPGSGLHGEARRHITERGVAPDLVDRILLNNSTIENLLAYADDVLSLYKDK